MKILARTTSYTKRDVIDAIMYAYGYTKREAEEYYRNTDESTHEALVEESKNTSRKSFYYD